MNVVAVEIDLLSPQVFGLKLKTIFSLKIYCQSKGKYCSLMYTFVFTLSLTACNCSNCGVCSLWKRKSHRTVSWQSTIIQMVSRFAVYSFIPLATFSSFYLFIFLPFFITFPLFISASLISPTLPQMVNSTVCVLETEIICFCSKVLKLSGAWRALYRGVLHKILIIK